jgi:hypothetical protein
MGDMTFLKERRDSCRAQIPTGRTLVLTVGAKSITRFLKNWYFCGKISRDTGMVESSGFFYLKGLCQENRIEVKILKNI